MFRNLFLVGFLFMMMVSSGSASFRVNSTADLPDANPGDLNCQASNGLCTLRAAVDEVNQGGGFWIDFESSNMTITIGSQLQLWNDDAIIEGFDDGSTIIQTSGLFTAFDVLGVSLTLRDLTVRYGSPAVKVSGDGEIVVMNCQLIDNGSPGWSDGTIDASPGSVTLIDSTIRNSASSLNGGAVFVYSPLAGTGLTVSGCTFTRNYAGQHGGAIYFAAGHVLVIKDSVFEDNTALASGGALAIKNYIPINAEIEGCEIINNSAVSGGAIAVFSDDVTDDRDLVIDSTNIGFNDASDSGGAIFLDSDGMSTVSLRNSSVYANETGFDGGGLHSAGSGIVEIVNSTFSLNEAGADGGGLYFSSSLTGALVYSSTITLNNADSDGSNDGDGGGIRVEGGAGTVYFRNTILAENDDLSEGTYAIYVPDCSAAIASEGYNLIGYANSTCNPDGPGDQVGGPANGAIDPVLGTLMQNAGWPTMAHPPLDDSPAIDAADPAGCFDVDGSLLTTDQVGRTRPHGGRGDIGAYETGPPIHIFSNGFDTGGAWYWSDVVGQ